MLAALLVAAAAQSVTLRIVDVDPASPAVLHNGYSVYLRIRYETDTPIQITAEPYSRGRHAPGARMSGAPVHAPGSGEAFYHFDFTQAATVDTIRLSAMRGRSVLATEDVPVSYAWDGQRGEPQVRADWVASQLAAEQRRQKQEFEAYSTGSGGIGAVAGAAIFAIFGLVALGSLAAIFVWPLWGVVRWRGRWRAAAAMPLALAAVWALKDARDLSIDPTSHNLLPFEFIEAAVVIVPYMIVVSFWKRGTSRS